MPHVVVKMFAGRTEDEKRRLSEQIVAAVTSALNYSEDSVSVGIEDVAPADWTEKVYTPEIKGRWETLYKKPGYTR